jgi:hypothetical protein
VARGNIIALANTHEESEARRAIKHEARSSMDFYWSRDKQRPFARARLALISPPRGGLSRTSGGSKDCEAPSVVGH